MKVIVKGFMVSSVENYLDESYIRLTSLCHDYKIDPKTSPCKIQKLNEETAKICGISIKSVIEC